MQEKLEKVVVTQWCIELKFELSSKYWVFHSVLFFLNIKQSVKTKVCNLTKIDSDSTNSTLLNILLHKK